VSRTEAAEDAAILAAAKMIQQANALRDLASLLFEPCRLTVAPLPHGPAGGDTVYVNLGPTGDSGALRAKLRALISEEGDRLRQQARSDVVR